MGSARAASQPAVPRGGDLVPVAPRPASAESATGVPRAGLEELASRLGDVIVGEFGGEAGDETEPAAGQGVRLMEARAKAFSKGPPPEPPAEGGFFGRDMGDPRRKL
eukprot:3414892-Alexandrium_andersonii.AAC.1